MENGTFDAQLRLLYICGSDVYECLDRDLDDPGSGGDIRLERCADITSGLAACRSAVPDLVAADFDADQAGEAKALPERLRTVFPADPPPVFVVLSRDPGRGVTDDLLSAGYCDCFFRPFSMKRFKESAGVYIENRHLAKREKWYKNRLDRTFSYLDSFREELARVKNELVEERNTLNNSLKQISLMTEERKRLKKELKQWEAGFRSNMDGFVDLLSKMIESRVERNRGHASRVAHIAAFTASRMGVSEKGRESLRKAALLHEVGLLPVPETLLEKREPDKDAAEADFITGHPARGARLLEICPGFEPIAEIVRYIYENVDGTGHPQGLKRKFIPLAARILAGADFFDELRHERAYDSLEELFEILETHAGSRLDPVVVNNLEKYAVAHVKSVDVKVKGVDIHQLEPGMTLFSGLFTATGTKLFSANTLLDRSAIDKIVRYNREYPVDDTIYVRA